MHIMLHGFFVNSMVNLVVKLHMKKADSPICVPCLLLNVTREVLCSTLQRNDA